MEKIYSMPCLYGTSFYCGKNSATAFVDEKGKTNLVSKKNKGKIILHNIILVRGLEYLIFGMYYFAKNLVMLSFKNNSLGAMQKVSKKLNINPGIVFVFLMLALSTMIGILLFGVVPIKLSALFTGYTPSVVLYRIVVALVKIALLYLILLSLKMFVPFRQFYRFNGCANLLLDNNKNIHKPTNFLNFIIFGFIFGCLVLSLIGISSDEIWKPFANLGITLLCFTLGYEILLILESSKIGWIYRLCAITSFLVTERPTKTEIYISQTALGEVKFMQDKNRKEIDTKLLKDNEYSFSSVYAECKEKLKNAGIKDKSEADWLVAEVLGITRGQLKLQTKVTQDKKRQIENATNKRIKGEPITKIFGRTNFFGLDFKVTKDVLSPRQETEILVESVIKNAKPKSSVLDIGTGSGIIAICIAKNTTCNVTAIDISQKALGVAKQNAIDNNVKVDFKTSNLFDNLKSTKKFDIIVSNPPYIPTKQIDKLEVEVKNYDPKLALDGGEDGLDFYKKIVEQCPKYLNRHGKIFFEIGIDQSQSIVSLLQKDFDDIQVIKDYNKIDRVIFATKRK